MPALILRCPQCPDIKQGTSVPLDKLKQLLDSGEKITVMGSKCGHGWALSDEEVKKLRDYLAAGAFGSPTTVARNDSPC
jgi:hypothetical protein